MKILPIIISIIFINIFSPAFSQNQSKPNVVARYDDADEYLPQIQANNKNNRRLFLRQQKNELLFKVLTPRNVLVDVIYNIPENSDTAVILLVGASGVLSIVNDRLDRSFSFQSRSRDEWWKHGIATFIVDAPSDKLGKSGMAPEFRITKDHLSDLQSVISEIRKKFNGKLIVYGHSRGAISAALIASSNNSQIVGYVFSSADYNTENSYSKIFNQTYNNPVIIVQHKNDKCASSTAAKFTLLDRNINTSKKDVIWINGEIENFGNPCGAWVPHSFFGQEAEVISRIAASIKSNVK